MNPITAPPDTDLAIIVVNYGSHALLEQNLGSLDRAALAARVIVVDNFSSFAERAAIGELAARHDWIVVKQPDNGGFGAGMNAGVAEAERLGCACYLLLNPDAVISRQAVEILHAHSLREPMMLIAPRIVSSTGAPYFHGSRLYLGSGRIRGHRREIAGPTPGAAEPIDPRLRRSDGTPVEWVTGACLIVHRQLMTAVGGFDEPYFLYWEDVDLSFRAQAAGGSVLVRDDVIVIHDEGGTQESSTGPAKSNTYYRYNCRNRLMFAARNLPRRTVVRWILLTPAASWAILMRGGRRQLIGSPKPLLAAIGGSLQGCAIALKALVVGRPRRRDGEAVIGVPDGGG